jgi:tetratricopeptide (TPR) repeat protein
MAIRRNKPKREKKLPNISPADTPSASELFVQPPVEITEEAADVVNMSSQPADTELCDEPASETQTNTPMQPSPQAEHASSPVLGNRPVSIRKSKFAVTQKVLIAGVIISAVLLTYSLVFSPSPPSPPSRTHVSQPTGRLTAKQPAAKSNAPQAQIAQVGITQPQVEQKEPNKPPAAAVAVAETNQNTQTEEQLVTQTETTATRSEATSPLRQPHTELRDEPASATPESSQKTEPLSLRLADEYFAAKDYVRTYSVCNKLRQNLPSKEFELVRDFLYFRMALCMAQKSNPDKANEMFRAVSESPSITLKALANYNLCLFEMNSGQYLKARTRAYKTIALTGAFAPDYKWALNLERNCQFLAAEAIARQTLSLSDADKELPRQLWYHENEKDPLTGLNEAELQKVLSAGIERFNAGLLAPQIQPVESSANSSPAAVLRQQDAGARWTVICNGPGIEELMARFASNTGTDVKWTGRTNNNPTTEQQPAGWNRSVYLFLPAATAQQVISTATGAVGLLAQINDVNGIIITDPTEYYTLSEHTRMLNEYSIWLWRKLLLMYSDDHRVANAHFVLGLLQEQKGQPGEAISEYKLVANRYAKTSLAPAAQLRSSRLKTGLRDYQGASRDLKQLIEQYPENELIGQAYLNLAETTMKAGMYEQACSQYRKSYSLALSTESKAISALGAGKCFYQQKEYEPALKWLTIYFETIDAQQPSTQKSAKPEMQNNHELYTAYLLLGKTHLALGNLQQACEILERTAKKANASDGYVEAIATLAETQMKQNDFVTALKTIENVRPWSFSQEQTTRLLLLKSKIMRESGLVEQTVALLADRIQYLTDTKLKAYVTLEMARCEIASNHLDLARSYLTDAIPSIDAGPDAQTASLELAEVCLKLKDYRQTISICKQLLDSSPSEQIEQQASKILAAAYSSQKDYDKAAIALLTLSAKQNTIKEKKTADTTEK